MLIIRFKPLGRAHRKHYRIVVADKKRHVSKFSIEDLGWYNPYTKEIHVKQERLSYYKDLNVEISSSLKSALSKMPVAA